MKIKDKKPLKYHIGKAHYFQDKTEYCIKEEDLKQAIKELKEVLTPELFHNLYEKYARISNWETHKDCVNKSFDELPETNQETMILTLEAIHKEIDKIFGDFEENKK